MIPRMEVAWEFRRGAMCLLGMSFVLGSVLYSKNMHAQTVDEVRNRGLAWLIQNQRGDGSWGAKPETSIATTALALRSFQTAGLKPSSYPYSSATTWLLNARPESIDSLARQIASLAYGGVNVSNKLFALQASSNFFFAWGSYPSYETSYPDTALALAAHRAAGTSFPPLQVTVYCEMLPAQLQGGGWGYFNPRVAAAPGGISAAAILPTVYNLLELKAINASMGWDANTCPGNAPGSIVAAINDAKAYLLTKKNADGGFGGGGVSSAVETALAHLALRTLNPADSDATAALNYLLAHQDASSTPARGSWNADAFQTALVLSSIPSPVTPLADTDLDGIPDGVEIALGKNPNVSDSRSLAQGGGNNFAGLNVASEFSATAIQLVPFTRTLAATGGTTPYSWRIASGSLPAGLSIGTTSGTISGTPTSAGTFPFTVAVTDAAGGIFNFAGSIAVQENSTLVNSILPALLMLLLDD